ncbi:MAG: cysteine desulfurase [Candidatus Zixiibacteriota bacterium]|nr:MAG: cysteine desulfurase [candidate division Zixibacteria bacterium]
MSSYFDYLSHTPIDPRVTAAMIPYLHEGYGNPISPHRRGREAARVLQESREAVAAFIGAEPDEIIFTSGEAESNNLAVKGLLLVHDHGQLLASAVEPLSVLRAAESLEKWGFSTTLIPVNAHGQVHLFNLEDRMNRFTQLASAAWVVAETGAVQPIEEVAELVRAASVPYHCDATHAARLFPIDVKELGVDALTLDANPLGGPPGVGALYLRKGLRIQPLLDGGAPELGRRAGQENLAGIAGFAKAAELALLERPQRFAQLKRLDSHLKTRFKEIPGLVIHADLPSRAPGIISCRLDGLEAEALLMELDQAGIYASSGSPCATLALKASHVLKAMGLTDEQANSTLNFSFGWTTETAEIEHLVETLKASVERLKAMSI